jgi:hypothetical protein
MTNFSSTWSNADVSDGRSHDRKPNSGDRIAHSSCWHLAHWSSARGSGRGRARVQFDIRYDTYNLVADPEVMYSIAPSGRIKFADFLHAIGVMKSKPNSWKDLVCPEITWGARQLRGQGRPSTSTLLKDQV